MPWGLQAAGREAREKVEANIQQGDEGLNEGPVRRGKEERAGLRKISKVNQKHLVSG